MSNSLSEVLRILVKPSNNIVNQWIVAFCIVALLTNCGSNQKETGQPGAVKSGRSPYFRIVSLSPSITETLFALGLGDRVVGVTRFCKYPPETAEKQSVGGYLDPNYEMITAIEPDLVLVLPEHESVRSYLDRLGIHHETLHNRTVCEIMGTIDTVGTLCGVESRADSLIADIENRMDAVRDGISVGMLPRVLVSIGRTMGTGSLKEIYVAGMGTHYDELILLAGGRNAYSSGNIAYPLLSAEGLLHLNPDIILDLAPDFENKTLSREAVLDEWRSVKALDAVKNNMVFLLTGDYTVIPGPRFILLLEDMATIIQANKEAQCTNR